MPAAKPETPEPRPKLGEPSSIAGHLRGHENREHHDGLLCRYWKRRSTSSRSLRRPLDIDRFKPPIVGGRALNSPRSRDPGKVRVQERGPFTWSRKVSRKHERPFDQRPDDQLPTHYGDDGYSMFVADGMGGMAAGEVASRLAITHGAQARQPLPQMGLQDQQERSTRALRAGQAITSRRSTKRSPSSSEADHRLFGMGTTLTVAYSVGVDLFIIHLGDSRAYLFREGDLQHLTKDHTVAQAMADAGYIAPEEVRHHRKRNVLTNFLGGHHGKVKGDVRWLRLADGDRLLLCSDGLTDMVDDDSICRILEKYHQPVDAAQRSLPRPLTEEAR